MISITKKIEFEAAHRISNYPGSCSEIHGHTYKLEVTVSGEINRETFMVMDFKDLKEILQKTVIANFDHALILKNNRENRAVFSSYLWKITRMETEPTPEQKRRLLVWMVSSIPPHLPSGVSLQKLELHETSGNFAIWKNIKG